MFSGMTSHLFISLIFYILVHSTWYLKNQLSMKTKPSIFSSILLCTFFVVEAQATALDDIGFTDLSLELGTALPDGSNITVTQVEAPISSACIPDTSKFPLISFIDHTQGLCTGISNHATSVAYRFYGPLSSSRAISSVDLFEAGNWLGTGFLNTGATQGLFPKTIEASIGIPTTRLINHSWAGAFVSSGWAYNGRGI